MNKKKKITRNKFHLDIQTKYRALIKENKKAYKRSRDKKISKEDY